MDTRVHPSGGEGLDLPVLPAPGDVRPVRREH